MTTLKNILNGALTAMALTPLAPVIVLMWIARGIQELRIARATVPSYSWESNTVVFPAGG